MAKLQTIIVDDEAPARNELDYLLTEIKEVELIGEADNGIAALRLIKEEQPDLVFLDIEMPGKNGLEVAEELQKMKQPPQIIFLTAYDQYALDAFKVNAINYILKPYETDEVYEAIAQVQELYPEQELLEEKLTAVMNELSDDNKKQEVDKLPVITARSRIKLLEYEKIIYIHTKAKKVYAVTKDKEYEVDNNLTELEEKLSSDFFRVHRSYIVNLTEIEEVIPWFKGKYQVVMADNNNQKIPVSRSKVKTLQEIFDL